MSEATNEQLLGLTQEEQEKLERHRADTLRSGGPFTSEMAQAFIRAIRQQPPVQREGISDSEARKRDAATGKSTVDFLLPPEPDVPLDRKYTKIEKEMLEIMEQATLKDYDKPPGKIVEVNKDKDKEKRAHKINWAEYGWVDAEKQTVANMLTQKFGLHGIQRERAMEVLLLQGCTANDIILKVDSSELKDIKGPIQREQRWRVFKEVFSTPDKPMPESSINVVFNDERHDDGNVFQTNPQSMEDLAWQLSWTGDSGGSEKWMVGGKFALLELRMKSKKERDEDIKRTNGQDTSWGKYYVNENHLLEWYRKELDLLYDIHGPNTRIEVNGEIKMRKGVYSVITFRDIIEQKGSLFESEDKKTHYDQTWLQLQWEANTFQTLYDNDIIYRQSSALGMEEWIKQYEQMTLMNPLTKTGFRTNMIQRLLTGTQDYKEGRVQFDQAKYVSDNILGGAFTEMVLAFYNLGDFQELQKVLGKDSSFFKLDGWIKAFQDIAKATAIRSGGSVVLAPETQKVFDDAFADGDLTSKSPRKKQQAFLDFVNFCTTNLPGAYQELFVTRAVQNSVLERFNVDEDRAGFNLTAAEAWFFTRFMGGLARNDVGSSDKGPSPSVHDKMSELLNMNANRMKYALGEGKPYGNLQTLGKHLAAAVAPMVGIVTQQEVHARDGQGRKVMIKGKDGHLKPLMKRKSILQVFEELHALRVQQYERGIEINRLIDSTTKKEEKEYLEQALKEHDIKYRDIVGRDVAFRENAHREYTQVHLKPGHKWMERIMHGKGIDLNKYTSFDAYGGVTVKREEFIKDIQSDLIGTVRDMLKKYKWMNMNEDVRMPFFNPSTHKMEFRNAKLAQTLFGYDVLNCEAFWKRDSTGRPIKRYGFAEIDFDRVEADRLQLMKQVFMTEIAGDLYNHQAANRGDQRFKQAYYLNFIEALKTISGEVVVDELAKHGITVPKNFMNDVDLDWLKARALNGKILWWDMGVFGFHLKWWITSLWDKTDKDGFGFGKMLSIIAKESFRSATG